MSRTPRDPARTRRLLLEAGARVLDDVYVSEAAEGPVLPINVSDVLNKVPEVAGEAASSLTTGAVVSAFGGKAQLLEELAAYYIGAERLIDGLTREAEALLRRDDDPRELRAELARHDFNNMVGAVAGTRHWFLVHAHAAAPKVREQLESVYREADRRLVPVYEELGRREGRAPSSGTTWTDVAVALTAWVEGQALRYLSSPQAREQVRWIGSPGRPGLMERGADGLWTGLTCPATH